MALQDSTIKVDFDRWRDESDDEYGDDFNFDSDVSLIPLFTNNAIGMKNVTHIYDG